MSDADSSTANPPVVTIIAICVTMLRATVAALIVFVLPVALVAQSEIPRGTILPVGLSSTIHSQKVRPNQRIIARVMQDVVVASSFKITAGSKVIGHVVAITPPGASTKATLTLQFDSVVVRGRTIPIRTNLRALANMMDVDEAKIPTSGPDHGTSEADWVTVQVGGDVVYHGAVVTSGSTVVGRSLLGNAVVAQVRSESTHKCRGDSDGQPQSLWVFSSGACGLYGYPQLSLLHAGRTDPIGEFTLQAAKGNVVVRGGSGMLLRVNDAQ